MAKFDWKLLVAALIAILASSFVADLISGISGGMLGSPVHVSAGGSINSILGLIVFLAIFVLMLRFIGHGIAQVAK